MKRVTILAIVSVLLVVIGTLGVMGLNYLDFCRSGQVKIDLEESNSDEAKTLVPGTSISKDTKITVKANSRECWVYVKIVESKNLKDFIEYSIVDGWSLMEGTDNVYYQWVETKDVDQVFSVIQDKDGNKDCMSVKESVTKEDLSTLTEDSMPTLNIKAAAVQVAGFHDMIEAYNVVKDN